MAEYIDPTVDVIEFDAEDVVLTSLGQYELPPIPDGGK